MSPDIIILLLGLVALMALGIPICFAMMSVASVILLVFYGSGLLNVLNAAFVYQMQSESLLAIPMFALMAAFLQTSGIGGDIYEFFHKWLGGINGSHRRYERCGGHRYHHDGADCTASYVGPWL